MEPHKPAKAGGGLGDRRKKKKKEMRMKKNIYMEKKIVKVECLQFKIDKEGKWQHNESGRTEGSERKQKQTLQSSIKLKRGTETQPERSI